MTDHPMLFSPPMIQALLREAKEPGTGKTQTRRIIKPQPHGRISMVTSFNHGRMEIAFGPDMRAKDGSPKWWRPLAQPGDRVWCREKLECANGETVGYPADRTWLPNTDWRWKRKALPSIHMPRELSRLTLYVTEVRVQRLQEISEEDALAEGVQRAPGGMWSGAEGQAGTTARAGYGLLWEQLNGPGSWEANPWVAAYTFVPRLGNIDTLPAALPAALMEDA